MSRFERGLCRRNRVVGGDIVRGAKSPSDLASARMAIRADELSVPRGRAGVAQRVRGWLDRESILGPVFVSPALILLVLLVAYPFAMALYFAMSNAFIGRPSEFVGLRNFIKLWDSDVFRQTFQNAFVFTGIAVAFKLVLGIALALLLN